MESEFETEAVRIKSVIVNISLDEETTLDEEMSVLLGWALNDLQSARHKIKEAADYFGINCDSELAELETITSKLYQITESKNDEL